MNDKTITFGFDTDYMCWRIYDDGRLDFATADLVYTWVPAGLYDDYSKTVIGWELDQLSDIIDHATSRGYNVVFLKGEE